MALKIAGLNPESPMEAITFPEQRPVRPVPRIHVGDAGPSSAVDFHTPFVMVGRMQQEFERRPPGVVSADLLMDHVRNGRLSEQDFDIIEAIYHLKFLTQNQILRLVFDNDKRDRCKNRLEKLYRYRVVNRFRWVYKDVQDVCKLHVYCFDQGGRILLERCRDEYVSGVKWHERETTRPISQVTSILITNEFYLRLLKNAREKGHRIDFYRVQPAYQTGQEGEFFVPGGALAYASANADVRILLLEPFREPTMASLEERVEAYRAFQAGETWQRYFGDKWPLTILLCENERQAVRASGAFSAAGIANRCTTDRRLVTMSVTECLFKVEDGVMKDVRATFFE